MELPVVYVEDSVETDNGIPCAFTAPVNPKDIIEIDNNANAKNPDNFIFILNHG